MKFKALTVLAVLMCAGCVHTGQHAAPEPGQWRSTRTTTYDWVCKTMNNSVIEGFNRQDSAFAKCANMSLKDGTNRQVSGGIYKIEGTPAAGTQAAAGAVELSTGTPPAEVEEPQQQSPAPGQWTSTRTTTYDWVCKKMDNWVISGHNRQDAAFAACANLVLADGVTRQVSGGIYRIEATPGGGSSGGTCTTPKPPTSQTVQCPSGQTGDWQQTRTVTSAPYPTCWTTGSWTPSSAPSGECTSGGGSQTSAELSWNASAGWTDGSNYGPSDVPIKYDVYQWTDNGTENLHKALTTEALKVTLTKNLPTNGVTCWYVIAIADWDGNPYYSAKSNDACKTFGSGKEATTP